MSPELEVDLRALETAPNFAEIKATYARVQTEANKRGAIFLAQLAPIALGFALSFWGAQYQRWLPDWEWIVPVGTFLGAVITHSFLFRRSVLENQRLAAALKKWRPDALRSGKSA